MSEMTSAERQAVFRLGQMDMQQSVVLMLRKLADGTMGMARSILRLAADCVETMDVSDLNTGGAADD